MSEQQKPYVLGSDSYYNPDYFRSVLGYEPPKHRILGFFVVLSYKLRGEL